MTENGDLFISYISRPDRFRYQPVSFTKLDSASGTFEQFKRMVQACNENNIRVYVDVVLGECACYHKNHCEPNSTKESRRTSRRSKRKKHGKPSTLNGFCCVTSVQLRSVVQLQPAPVPQPPLARHLAICGYVSSPSRRRFRNRGSLDSLNPARTWNIELNVDGLLYCLTNVPAEHLALIYSQKTSVLRQCFQTLGRPTPSFLSHRVIDASPDGAYLIIGSYYRSSRQSREIIHRVHKHICDNCVTDCESRKNSLGRISSALESSEATPRISLESRQGSQLPRSGFLLENSFRAILEG